MIHWTWILNLIAFTGILFCIGMMFRPIKGGGGDYGDLFELAFRAAWIIPILLITTIYFAILYFAR